MDAGLSEVTLQSSLADYAMAEHRELEVVHLTGEVTTIGRHAFYNCRHLRRISFWDTVKDIGDGAFKNCEELSELIIYQSGRGNYAGMKSILSELTGAFTVFLVKEGQTVGSFYFPPYLHDYEENNEARIINQVTYGAGVHYRECVREAGIDLAGYDRTFRWCVNLADEVAWRVAYYRCTCPVELREEDRLRYREWLHAKRSEVLREMIGTEAVPTVEQGSMTALRHWLALDIYQTDEEWMEAIEQVKDEGKWEAVSLLMQERQKRYGERKRKFEF